MDDPLEVLLAVDPAVLPAADRVEHLARLNAVASRVSARMTRTYAAIEADPPAVSGLDAKVQSAKQWVREEVACRLKLAPSTAALRLGQAADLLARHSAVLDAVEAGAISPLHARLLTEFTRPLSEDIAARVQQRVMGRPAPDRGGVPPLGQAGGGAVGSA